MEYVQMTIDDWIQMKQKLKQELLGVKQSFVRIGYALRKIEDQRLYEQDGYKSIAEFAKTEYGLEPSTTSRFMAINREYSVDGYSERLRPEFSDLGRSQLEEMLKLPDSDRQMIQPETSREDIRDLKRFNKTAPAAGVADDIRQLVEKFYKDNPDILNAVFSEDLQNTKKLAEIINPGGNRSYKKGLYFLMMYENRITIKKFGSTPQDMTWEEFIQLTVDIFGGAAAGAKTWNNYFGEESAEKPDQDHPTETPVEEKKGDAEDHGAADEARRADEETGKAEDDDTAGEESGESDCQESAAGETAEPAGAESQGEEIAPAQKSPESLERAASDEAKNGENCGAEESESDEDLLCDDCKNASCLTGNPDLCANCGPDGRNYIQLQKENEEPEAAAVEGPKSAAVEETAPCSAESGAPDIIEKRFGTRKDYINTLTAHDMAMYMAEEYERHTLKASCLAFPSELEKWLLQEVDENGQEVRV